MLHQFWLLMIHFGAMRFIILLIVASGVPISKSCGAARYNTSTVAFTGNSSGGTLTLMKAPLVNYPYIEVTNHAGEGANVVIRRLADELDHSTVCKDYYGNKPVVDRTETSLQLSGGPTVGSASTWIIGGSESGFGIPDAPKSVSAEYRPKEIVVSWINPDSIYDSITVITDGISWGGLPGNRTHFAYPLDALNPIMNTTSVCFIVVGNKSGMPSNGSSVWLRRHVEQRSLMNVPFTKGLAPNFSAWSSKRPGGGSIVMEEGRLRGVGPGKGIRGLERNGFYQVIKGVGQFDGGVWRRFLGLTPGNTYRVSARMNTWQMNAGDWSFSLNAAPDSQATTNLTPEQMFSSEPLPGKTHELRAGTIVELGPTNLTNGKWVTQSSSAATQGRAKTDLTVPDGVTSITVWFRYKGNEITNSVAFDSLSIEDLGKK